MFKENLLMVAGPVEIERDILALGSKPLVYNRTEEFKDFLAEIYLNLQNIFETTNPVFVLASSGTGAMEAAVTNILSKGDYALYVNSGTFGKRWGEICQKNQICTIEIKLDYGVCIKAEQIQEQLEKNKKIKAVLIAHNETSTATLNDLKSIAEVVRGFPNTILVADCIASLLVEPVKTDQWGIDVVVGSSQKALAIPPGLGFISFSKKAFQFVKKTNFRLYYFDALEYLFEWEKKSTPFTPPVSLLFQLDARLKKIKKEGLENYRNRYFLNTQILRKGLSKLNLSFFGERQPNCITGVLAPEGISAERIVYLMRAKHKINICPGWPELKTKLFRIGNFGNIKAKEIRKCLNALKLTLEELEYL